MKILQSIILFLSDSYTASCFEGDVTVCVRGCVCVLRARTWGCAIILRCDWQPCNQRRGAQTGLLSSREYAMIWEYPMSSLVKTIQAVYVQKTHNNKGRHDTEDRTDTRASPPRHPASKNTEESQINNIDCLLACARVRVCACVFARSSRGNDSYASHTLLC